MSGKRDANQGQFSASRSNERNGLPSGESVTRRKRIAAVAVGGIILFALVAFLWPPLSGESGQSSGKGIQTASADRVDVVYFHRTERCQSCLWTGEAVSWTMKTYFAAELASGKVTYKEVDVQKPENSELVGKFRATGSSLFLNFVKSGQDNIVQASDTYPYIGNTERFSDRLRSRIAGALGVAP